MYLGPTFGYHTYEPEEKYTGLYCVPASTTCSAPRKIFENGACEIHTAGSHDHYGTGFVLSGVCADGYVDLCEPEIYGATKDVPGVDCATYPCEYACSDGRWVKTSASLGTGKSGNRCVKEGEVDKALGELEVLERKIESNSGGECSSFRDCGENGACFDGFCVAACSSDDECDEGLVCTGYCSEITGSCSGVNECPGGEWCRDGSCVGGVTVSDFRPSCSYYGDGGLDSLCNSGHLQSYFSGGHEVYGMDGSVTDSTIYEITIGGKYFGFGAPDPRDGVYVSGSGALVGSIVDGVAIPDGATVSWTCAPDFTDEGQEHAVGCSAESVTGRCNYDACIDDSASLCSSGSVGRNEDGEGNKGLYEDGQWTCRGFFGGDEFCDCFKKELRCNAGNKCVDNNTIVSVSNSCTEGRSEVCEYGCFQSAQPTKAVHYGVSGYRLYYGSEGGSSFELGDKHYQHKAACHQCTTDADCSGKPFTRCLPSGIFRTTGIKDRVSTKGLNRCISAVCSSHTSCGYNNFAYRNPTRPQYCLPDGSGCRQCYKVDKVCSDDNTEILKICRTTGHVLSTRKCKGDTCTSRECKSPPNLGEACGIHSWCGSGDNQNWTMKSCAGAAGTGGRENVPFTFCAGGCEDSRCIPDSEAEAATPCSSWSDTFCAISGVPNRVLRKRFCNGEYGYETVKTCDYSCSKGRCVSDSVTPSVTPPLVEDVSLVETIVNTVVEVACGIPLVNGICPDSEPQQDDVDTTQTVSNPCAGDNVCGCGSNEPFCGKTGNSLTCYCKVQRSSCVKDWTITNCNGRGCSRGSCNSSPEPEDCLASTEGDCELDAAGHGGYDYGVCVGGTSGSCEYGCSDGDWIERNDTCEPISTGPQQDDTDTTQTVSNPCAGDNVCGCGSNEPFCGKTGNSLTCYCKVQRSSCVKDWTITNCNGRGCSRGSCNSSPEPEDCLASTEGDCELDAAGHGGYDYGVCVGGTSGSCEYGCSDGDWIERNDTCEPISTGPQQDDTDTTQTVSNPCAGDNVCGCGSNEPFCGKTGNSLTCYCKVQRSSCVKDWTITNCNGRGCSRGSCR